MDSLSGRTLTVLAVVLMAAAAGAAVRVVVTGGLRPADALAGAPGTGPGAAEQAGLAKAAALRGDVAEALSRYRKAASLNPRCLDRRSPDYLGPAFEASFRKWAADIRSGRLAVGPAARDDAAYLFRRLYGGCG